MKSQDFFCSIDVIGNIGIIYTTEHWTKILSLATRRGWGLYTDTFSDRPSTLTIIMAMFISMIIIALQSLSYRMKSPDRQRWCLHLGTGDKTQASELV